MGGKPYDEETRNWIAAADTPKEHQRRKNRAKYLRHREKMLAKARDAYAKNPGKILERNAEWRKSNPERVAELKNEWAKSNPEKISAARKRFYRKNRESELERCSAYREENKQRYAAHQAKRRARKYHATPAWANDFFIEEIYDLAKLRTDATGIPWEVDHIVPLQGRKVCGLHVENNLQVIPMVSNRSKSNAWA